MKITTRQAAQILGYQSIDAVRRLVAEGALRDYRVTQPGRVRHAMRLDLDEVRALARTYQPRRRTVLRPRPTWEPQGQDLAPVDPPPAPKTPPPVLDLVRRVAALETRLTAWGL